MEILNKVILVGKAVEGTQFSHEFKGERFLVTVVGVKRNSGTLDVLPVIHSEKLGNFNVGDKVRVQGSFRSRNEIVNEKKRLVLNVFADEMEIADIDSIDINKIELTGYICKVPVRRKTSAGREICDLLIASNRTTGKADYIPCISWGRNATYSEKLQVGEKVEITGRVQSRGYQKKINDTEFEDRVAYEVSVVTIFENSEEE